VVDTVELLDYIRDTPTARNTAMTEIINAYDFFRSADETKTVKVFGPKDKGSTVYKYLKDGKPFGALIRTSDEKFLGRFPIKLMSE
jgi:hypothetical protein